MSSSSPSTGKRKSLTVASSAASTASAASTGVLQGVAAAAGGVIELDATTGSMTVEQYLQHRLAVLTEKAQEFTDDAIDAVAEVHKQQREEIRNMQHTKKAEQAAKNKAGKKKVVDVHLTVERTSDEQPELEGTVFVVCPRQRPGGMAKIGRSSGDDFLGSKGVSLPKDWGVSTWHGKFTSVYGTIYYTDLSKYGTKVNGSECVKDQPVALKSGDELELGSTLLSVKLTTAVPTKER